MTPSDWAIIVVGAIAAGFVQGLSGFAFGLVAMSFWAWRLEPALAAALAVTGGLTGQIASAITVRRKFDWKLLAPFLAGGLVGIPMGAALLPHLNAHVFKAILGGLLVCWCPLMLLSRRFPPVTLESRLADGTAGLMGGVFGGIGGFTGVIPTLWCTLQVMDKDTQRSIVQTFNLVTLAATLLAYVVTGAVTADMAPAIFVVAPTMLIPSMIGARIYIGVSDVTFRRIVLSLLTASGVALLASSLPGLV